MRLDGGAHTAAVISSWNLTGMGLRLYGDFQRDSYRMILALTRIW